MRMVLSYGIYSRKIKAENKRARLGPHFADVHPENTIPLTTTGGSGTDMDRDTHMGSNTGFPFSTPNWKPKTLPESDMP